PQGQKSQTVYLLLAFFLGFFGIHNFYAGYIGRGVTQLLFALFGWMSLGILWIVNIIWVGINIFSINKDATGTPFIPNPVLKIILGIFYLLSGVLVPLCVMLIGGIAGYTTAMNRYQANEIIDYTTKVFIVADMNKTTKKYPTSGQCSNFIPVESDTVRTISCHINIDAYGNQTIELDNLPPNILRTIERIHPKTQKTGTNSITYSF
ncbi:MAG: TM2 domain-containing protein, partial [Lactobacillales bacterium]|nr:TM2 domain-containing protein [Lactobacillales bacterium]